jgi:hypothetical protein
MADRSRISEEGMGCTHPISIPSASASADQRDRKDACYSASFARQCDQSRLVWRHHWTGAARMFLRKPRYLMLVEVSGLSAPTVRKFIGDRVDLFRKLKRGVWEVRDPKADRAAAK